MGCLFYVAIWFFTIPPLLLAGPLPEDEFESVYGPSSSARDSSPYADILTGYPSEDDIPTITTDSVDTYLTPEDPSLFSPDSSSTEADQTLLESSCDLTQDLGLGKLRARDDALCLRKSQIPPLQSPKILSPSPDSLDLVPIPVGPIIDFRNEDKCPPLYPHHLCCDFGPELSVWWDIPIDIDFYEEVGGCYASMMPVLLHILHPSNLITGFAMGSCPTPFDVCCVWHYVGIRISLKQVMILESHQDIGCDADRSQLCAPKLTAVNTGNLEGNQHQNAIYMYGETCLYLFSILENRIGWLDHM